jgi:NodT family efflux transporter outer membrane factor (OMF) lipoprotein
MFKTLLVCLAASVTAWAAGPPAPKANVTSPSTFRNQPDSAGDTIVSQWWKGFGDPLLNELIERAEQANLDVRKAASRLAETEALRRGSRSALLPDIGSSTSVSELRGGFNQGVVKIPSSGGAAGGNLVSAFDTGTLSSGFNMRWELDVFGGLRKSLAAASADAAAAASNVRDVQAIVRAEVARNYVDLRAAEDQIAIVRANVASEQDLLDLVRVRADAGLATGLDVERQVAQLASVQATLPDLDTQRLRAIHRIGVLLGEDPTALRDQLELRRPPLQVPEVPRAVPSELLKRRPDIRRAEAQIAAAYARAGAARADLYPKIVIMGLSGRQSTDLSGLTLGAGNFFSIGPGISLPLFNFGRIRSQIAARDAQLEQAQRSYEQDVLAAFEETENALVARDSAGEQQRDLEVGLAAAKQSVELARELYVRGLSDFLTVLDAQRQQFALERELAASNAAVLSHTIALLKALGG